MKGKKDIRTKDRVDTKEKEPLWTAKNTRKIKTKGKSNTKMNEGGNKRTRQHLK